MCSSDLLAWLFNSSNAFHWKNSTHYTDYFEGASERARRHGYHLESFDANVAIQQTKRLVSIFAARNIGGILICPQPTPHAVMRLPWQNFSTISFGYSLDKPHLHTITSAHYLATREVYTRLNGLGYRRIGFCIPQISLERTNFNHLAGYLVSQSEGGGACKAEAYTEHPRNLSRFGQWIRRNQLDAIIAEDGRVLGDLAKLGLKVPGDIGVASPCLPRPDSILSGVVEECFKIGAMAVDFLVAAIQRGDKGLPAPPQRIHVEGNWHEGKTLRRPKRHRT